VSIREVAKKSGVSIATVSRVLNNYPDVSDETRRRVLEAAREIDYTPTQAARTLVTKRSWVIGVILFTGLDHPDIQHPFFQEVLAGLKHGVGAAGYDLLLFANEADSDGAGRQSYLTRTRHHHLDGVAVMGVSARDPMVRELARSPVACVAVDIDLVGPRTGYVMSDNVGGAARAVRHLFELGHQRIALIGGPTETRPGADRLLGYRKELDTLDLEYSPAYVQIGDFYPQSGEDAMRALLALPEPPTAVFAASDLMAVGAVGAAREHGLSVPEDLAVVGFDDVQIAALGQPPLTTIRQDKVALGLRAAESLVEMIDDPKATPPALTVPVELVVRESCGSRVRVLQRGDARG
jgi:LacI family transcriptional regulator